MKPCNAKQKKRVEKKTAHQKLNKSTLGIAPPCRDAHGFNPTIFVVPLQLDSFVPVRDIGILRIMWILTSECVCGDARCHFCCPFVPLLGDNHKRPESSNHRLWPGVLTTLLVADKHRGGERDPWLLS